MPPVTRSLRGVLGVVLALACGCNRGTGAASAPFTPDNDTEVLEQVPARATDARARERAALRQELDRQPRQLELAVRLARLELKEGRARGDPRHLGRAQAALAPWWDEAEPPHEVRLLRATLRQSRHEFDAALRDLEAAVREDPRDAQAWLTRAVVLGVRGHHAEAEKSCAPLDTLAGALTAAVCRAQVDSVAGHSRRAYARLSEAMSRRGGMGSPEEQAWALSTLGEAAARAGDSARAELLYTQALAADPDDAYTRAALADLLLDLNRPGDASRLMKDHATDDGHLLRRVLAETALGSAQAPALAQELAERYAASRLRGDTLHAREEARFALHVEKDARKALSLAQANWEAQREPWDVRVLLESALAAGAPEAARPALTFLDASSFEDPGLLALAERLKKAAP
ncbi:tetratricopeptide repeat protein [Myxococcus sp. CA033]|uniref:tetratricopeptide repeat protein n=1 Tax=Myxococcus sp. CA033 TaxID=2741516 RepID=UPI00157A6399|nr:tetratricopeptide repeat protein [Myxococcus sp. CA033]NTX38307.1 tetratricopeptide repeat protein [Myxococcus sp. CA033]